MRNSSEPYIVAWLVFLTVGPFVELHFPGLTLRDPLGLAFAAGTLAIVVLICAFAGRK